MRCPYCRSNKIKVIDKRDNIEANSIRRRRECEHCGKRFTTYERLENILLKVKKRGGEIEEFNKEKLKMGILKAVSKREIPSTELDKITDKVERHLLNLENSTIESKKIGGLVLRELSKIDQLGALLFASVYKHFDSLDDVLNEIDKLNKE